MRDKNGVEIKTGDVVKICNAYFKSDDGLFFVRYAPGDPDWSGEKLGLHRINRWGKVSNSKNSVGFWPILIKVLNKNLQYSAQNHNEENATIEIMEGIDKHDIKDEFAYEAFLSEKRLVNDSQNYGDNSTITKHEKAMLSHYREVMNRIDKENEKEGEASEAV